MKATNTGKAIFQSGPADIFPDHQSLLFGDNLPLDPARIGYGQADLLIRPAVIVVDDSFDVAASSGPIRHGCFGQRPSHLHVATHDYSGRHHRFTWHG